MPTYSYRCSACANEFEQFQKFTEDPLTDCPACGGSVRRVIHPVGVVFKGSGWYITDNRKSNGSETASADKPAESESSAKSGDSDAKPADAKAKKETTASPA